MSLGLARRSHGLDTPRDEPWETRAACALLPDLFFTGKATMDAQAVHVCQRHCPVLRQCRRSTEQDPPTGVVQAGLVWVDAHPRHKGRRPTAVQPKQVGCASFCQPWRPA